MTTGAIAGTRRSLPTPVMSPSCPTRAARQAMASSLSPIFPATGAKKFSPTSHGQLAGKYLLVSEAPGKESLLRQQYWTGVGGQILRSCTKIAGTTLENLFYLTDIVKCWPNENGSNRTALDSEIQNCSHFLIKEIEELKQQLEQANNQLAQIETPPKDKGIKSLFKFGGKK